MNSLKIVFFSITAPVGGHIRSAVTIAEALRVRGHDVTFVTGDGPGVQLIQSSAFEHLTLPYSVLKGFDFNWRNFPCLREFILQKRPHILHSFLKGIPQLSLLARLSCCKLVATICGGHPQRFFPKMSPITVFSEELKIWLLSAGISPNYIYNIPGRMNLNSPPFDASVDAFHQTFSLANVWPVVMMICRTDTRKRPALNAFFQSARIWGEKHRNGIFIHIGTGNEPNTHISVRKEAISINRKVGRTVLISTDFGSADPAKYLHLATIAVGMGRSAFESMALAKPTCVLSNEGFGGLVCKDEIDHLAHHNFTGRSSSSDYPRIAEAPMQLAAQIEMLVRDPEMANQSGLYGKYYCYNTLGVEKAAEQYEAIYLDDEPGTFFLPSFSHTLYAIVCETIRSAWYTIK